jgi:hypothetical protein
MIFENTVREKLAAAPARGWERDLYKVIIGEIQQGKILNDGQYFEFIEKIIKANEQNLGFLGPDDARRQKYLDENRVLQELLSEKKEEEKIPFLTAEEIRQSIKDSGLEEELKSCQNPGKAIGFAMEHFKKNGIPVEGSVVKQVVLEIRT